MQDSICWSQTFCRYQLVKLDLTTDRQRCEPVKIGQLSFVDEVYEAKQYAVSQSISHKARNLLVEQALLSVEAKIVQSASAIVLLLDLDFGCAKAKQIAIPLAVRTLMPAGDPFKLDHPPVIR